MRKEQEKLLEAKLEALKEEILCKEGSFDFYEAIRTIEEHSDLSEFYGDQSESIREKIDVLKDFFHYN